MEKENDLIPEQEAKDNEIVELKDDDLENIVGGSTDWDPRAPMDDIEQICAEKATLGRNYEGDYAACINEELNR
ncbi:MAG: hypothetical protein MJ250_02545 [Alphaproteobacteria bacterium]|nr:hypothetical protein [Alphaproteobacteria bacterium]